MYFLWFINSFSNKKVLTPGDEYDVLVCFNPASLKVNLKNVKEGGIIILDSANFTPRSLQTAGYTSNPLEDNSLEKYNVIKVPVSEIILNTLLSIYQIKTFDLADLVIMLNIFLKF